jgi:hypothetical protein
MKPPTLTMGELPRKLGMLDATVMIIGIAIGATAGLSAAAPRHVSQHVSHPRVTGGPRPARLFDSAGRCRANLRRIAVQPEQPVLLYRPRVANNPIFGLHVLWDLSANIARKHRNSWFTAVSAWLMRRPSGNGRVTCCF